MTPAEKIAVLENEIKHLRADHEEVKSIALASQKLLRWALGASAAIGAVLPVIAPKVLKLLGLG